MLRPVTILPLLSNQEKELVILLANIVVEKILENGYQNNKKGNQISEVQQRRPKQQQHRKTGYNHKQLVPEK